MTEFLEDSLFAGVTISLLAYILGYFLKKKFKLGFLNPLLISIAATIVAVLFGIVSGVITSLATVFVLAKLMGLTHEEYVTLLPKSITTAIGMGVSDELGGYVTITVAVIIITGVLGNIFGELICRLFRITEPISKGLAIGSASHAIGTAKAMELGEVEGAMSSLAIAVAGVLTVIGATIFSYFI